MPSEKLVRLATMLEHFADQLEVSHQAFLNWEPELAKLMRLGETGNTMRQVALKIRDGEYD